MKSVLLFLAVFSVLAFENPSSVALVYITRTDSAAIRVATNSASGAMWYIEDYPQESIGIEDSYGVFSDGELGQDEMQSFTFYCTDGCVEGDTYVVQLALKISENSEPILVKEYHVSVTTPWDN